MSDKINQPDNMEFGGCLKIEWNPSFGAQTQEKMHRVQCAIDSAALKYMYPYMPFRSGALIKLTETATVAGSGRIVCPGPYAHYLYMGEIYGPNIPIREGGQTVGFFSPPSKQKTGRPLTYDTTKNPLAGAHWFERMKADHKDDILKVAQYEANR